MPRSHAVADFTLSSSSSARSSTLVFHTLRNSMWPMDSCASVSSCFPQLGRDLIRETRQGPHLYNPPGRENRPR